MQAGQIVVHGDHVDALAFQGVQVHRQGGHQGLALAGAHFGDAAGVQADAADHLHVEVALAQHPLGGLADRGEGFVQQGIQALAPGDPGLELVGLAAERLVAERLELRLQSVDLGHARLHGRHPAIIG